MKSYNHLWEKFISDENIKEAIKNSSRGKRKRKEVKRIFENQEECIPKIRHYAENFKNSKHTPKEIYDGISRKKRIIIVPDYREQIVHHMAVNVLKPIFLHGMYERAYGSIPGRGAHHGKKVIEKWIKSDTKNVKYCLKMDIAKYFNNISHDVLKIKLNKIIRDKRFLGLLFEIIDATETGLPLGFYTSQWFASWYLQDLDHTIKETMYAPHYIRYMDDMIIFGSNKKKLHDTKESIEAELKKLGLRFNNKWQIFRFVHTKNGKEMGRDLDFMGFRFFRNRTILRKGIMFKMLRKARKIGNKDSPTAHDYRQMLSYLGYIKACDVYGVYKEYVKPFVNFQKAKRKISKMERRIYGKNGKFRQPKTA